MDDPRDRGLLVYYPYVVVRIGCEQCARYGAYRLARLAARYGPEITLAELLRRIVAAECPILSQRKGQRLRCAARNIDLEPPAPPPDLPPAPLRVIEGGKKAKQMCGRIIQASGPLKYAIVDGLNVVDSRYANMPPRFNGAPSQDILVIRQNHETGERSLDPLKWGLIPYWCKDANAGRKPINAKAETVAMLPTFRDAYRRRRCIVPVDGFFEWKAIKGQKAKQPYAIAMKDGTLFGIAGLWENWKDPRSGDWIRTFTIVTTDANELVADIHDRMPAILAPADYGRWLGSEPDPSDLLRPYPADLMRMWPVSMRVNKPENDDPSIIERVDLAASAA